MRDTNNCQLALTNQHTKGLASITFWVFQHCFECFVCLNLVPMQMSRGTRQQSLAATQRSTTLISPMVGVVLCMPELFLRMSSTALASSSCQRTPSLGAWQRHYRRRCRSRPTLSSCPFLSVSYLSNTSRQPSRPANREMWARPYLRPEGHRTCRRAMVVLDELCEVDAPVSIGVHLVHSFPRLPVAAQLCTAASLRVERPARTPTRRSHSPIRLVP